MGRARLAAIVATSTLLGLAAGLLVRPREALAAGAPGTDPAAEHTQQVGRWNPSRDTAPSDPTATPLAEVAALPYKRGSQPAPQLESVTTFDPRAAQPGFNLVLSADRPHAWLMDMKGNVVHEWHKEATEVWPRRTDLDSDHMHYFRRAALMPDGGLLVVFEYIGLIRLDRDSNLLWAYEGNCHHDVWPTASGEIYVLTTAEHDATLPRHAGPPAFLSGHYMEDFVTVLSADGEVLRQVSVLDCFLHSQHGCKLGMRIWTGDVLHTNSVAVLDGRHADRVPAFRAGNVLVCARNINTVAVLDLDAGKVVWAMQGLWTLPHEPNLLDNGHILIFDNLGLHLQSQVLEVDPVTQQVVWSYRGTPEHPFFSSVCGSTQRLENGDTLIVETNAGHAFEVDPSGRIVWEFYNPSRAGEDGELIASLMDCVRIDPAALATSFPELAAAADPKRTLDTGGVDALLRSRKR